MKVEWMNHTGFVVSDMERSLAFYRDLLGLRVERDDIQEGEFVSQANGFPNARLHVIWLGLGDMKHSVELIQYLNPPGRAVAVPGRNDVGAAHLGINVDDLGSFYEKLSGSGIRFLTPPAVRKNASYPQARKVCYLQDPDGNWLELLSGRRLQPAATQA